jgi:hypothetical protein
MIPSPASMLVVLWCVNQHIYAPMYEEEDNASQLQRHSLRRAVVVGLCLEYTHALLPDVGRILQVDRGTLGNARTDWNAMPAVQKEWWRGVIKDYYATTRLST